MPAQRYEVEVKSLLGTEENAHRFKKNLADFSKGRIYLTAASSQLNHYFEGGTPEKLFVQLEKYLKPSAKKQMKEIIAKAKNVSVRTRESDGVVKFVMKASLGTDSSANGVIRIELEETVPMTLGELDKKIQKAGYKYQAKWSRQREELHAGDITVCIDKNAGYGYLVEFEKVLKDKKQLTKARADIFRLMKQLKVAELDQGRLERMFNYYNKNWAKYYGTNNVFTIK